MAQKRDGPNWKKIKAEYVRGGISQAKLAEKHGVSFRTLKEHARKEKWSELREMASTKAAQKMVEKTADIQADTTARMIQMQNDAALAIYKKLMMNIVNYPEGVGTKTMRETVEVKKVKVNGEEREFPLKSAFVNDLEAIVRSMTSLARLYGIDAASQISRERFEIQKQQGGAADNVDSFNENMVSIAELIAHPMPNRTMDQIDGTQPGGVSKDD